jgi:TRAP-type C4-dicarboxylate transport system permease small subunit
VHKALVTLDRLIRLVTRLSFALAVLATLALMLVGSVDVLATLVGMPVPAALEMQEVLLAISIFLGFAHVQSRHEQIGVDIIVTRFPRRVRRAAYLLMLLFSAAVFAIIAWRSATLAASSWEVREAASALFAFPIYPGKFLVSIGAAVASIECVRQVGWWFVGDELELRRRNKLESQLTDAQPPT